MRSNLLVVVVESSGSSEFEKIHISLFDSTLA